jgi:hypothetical protein
MCCTRHFARCAPAFALVFGPVVHARIPTGFAHRTLAVIIHNTTRLLQSKIGHQLCRHIAQTERAHILCARSRESHDLQVPSLRLLPGPPDHITMNEDGCLKTSEGRSAQ